jgi:hypothetical protein
LVLKDKDFEIRIYEGEDDARIINLRYTISRPGHDHDNHPYFLLTIPKGGACRPDHYPDFPIPPALFRDIRDRNVKLEIHDDSGYLPMDLFHVPSYVPPSTEKRIKIDPRGNDAKNARKLADWIKENVKDVPGNIESLLETYGGNGK